jgi:hypothetical protein
LSPVDERPDALSSGVSTGFSTSGLTASWSLSLQASFDSKSKLVGRFEVVIASERLKAAIRYAQGEQARGGHTQGFSAKRFCCPTGSRTRVVLVRTTTVHTVKNGSLFLKWRAHFFFKRSVTP